MNEALEKAGLKPLAPEMERQFRSYLELLLKWNARLNLTAIREPEEIVERHFVESIFAAQNLPSVTGPSGIGTLLDFGSGGGFPGIPIAICCPEIRVTLGESQAKKAAFLREAVRTLGLGNAEIFDGRVEKLDRQFDAVTLRAVDRMEEACRVALEKVKPGGYFVPFLTGNAEEAFEGIAWESRFLLPGSEQRVLLIGRKS